MSASGEFPPFADKCPKSGHGSWDCFSCRNKPLKPPKRQGPHIAEQQSVDLSEADMLCGTADCAPKTVSVSSLRNTDISLLQKGERGNVLLDSARL